MTRGTRRPWALPIVLVIGLSPSISVRAQSPATPGPADAAATGTILTPALLLQYSTTDAIETPQGTLVAVNTSFGFNIGYTVMW